MTEMKVQEAMKCPKEIANLVGQYLPKGKETEVNSRMFFENVSRNMVLLAKKCPKGTKDSNYPKHYAAVLGAFEKRRNGHKCFKGKWSTYLNDQSGVWKSDYDKVWDDYIKGRLI